MRVLHMMGTPTSGKTSAALAIAAGYLQNGREVLWVSGDDAPGELIARLVDLGVTDRAIGEHFTGVYQLVGTDDAWPLIVVDSASDDDFIAALNARPEHLVMTHRLNAFGES